MYALLQNCKEKNLHRMGVIETGSLVVDVTLPMLLKEPVTSNTHTGKFERISSWIWSWALRASFMESYLGCWVQCAPGY